MLVNYPVYYPNHLLCIPSRLEDLEYVVGGLDNTQNAAKFIYDKSVNKEDCGNTSMTIL